MPGSAGRRESKVAEEIRKERNAKATGEIIAEQKQIRKLAQAYGCKTATDFCELMTLIIGRGVEAASALNDDERSKAIAWLTEANAEKGAE